MIERILKDICVSDSDMSVAVLRYFNPIGAHKSGLIGEDPNGIPNNLLPYIAQVGIGKLKALSVFGNDYPTHDGTGVRDYIHVVDLAKAHIKALVFADKNTGIDYFNIGTGVGYSVLDVVKAYEKASGLTIAYKIVDRRPGDIAECYADPTKAKEVLGWEAEYGIETMCEDLARWQKNNPNGYGE
jgi:UDP-glucose 4-epimerase